MMDRPLETVASDAEPIAGARQYKPYPAYKDSGVEWFDEIPKHWEVLQIGRIGNLSKCNGGTKADEVPEGVPCIRYGDLYTYHTCFIQQSRSYVSTERASDYTPVQFGDILFAASGETIDEIGKSAVNLIDTQACCGGDVIRLRPTTNANARFMGYAADSSAAAFEKGRMGRGITVMHVYGDELKYLALAVPCLSEQHAIASYLDRETAKIDAFVAKKKRLIELLQEKRTALITRAVTKGIDPDAPTKDSGIEWLGGIPAHWVVMPVWTLFELGRGRVISHEDIHDNPGPYPVYSSQTEHKGVMGHIATYDFRGTFLTWTTDGAKAGAVFRRNGKFNCTNVCGTLRPLRTRVVAISFVEHALNQATAWFVRHDINPKLMNNVMAGIRIQVPPIAEQNAIASYVDRETTKIDALVAKIHEAIDRLRELRIALISAAVTGKIDVREAVS